ncbi:HCLS1-associated protein X-1 isoform X1 [Engystomops pustulosus]|uniref:HCLS1-associated protein X-1 isoform X1 n=1 Tax=Engystomops pustulosus TaxID=76066 RepID=UPI003AFB2EC9
MSVFDLFRRFFYPPGTRDSFFGGMTLDEDEDDEEDEEGDFFFHHESGFPQEPPSWRSRPPFHDPFGFDDFFRDFNELFADFGSMIPELNRHPGIEPPAQGPGGSGRRSLRDFMLKHPDSHLPRDKGPSPSEGPRDPRWLPPWDNTGGVVPPGDTKQDKILDSVVSSRGLDSLMRPQDSGPPPSSSSFFRSVSVSKVVRPDGTVEERRTTRDSEGNTTTTVTVTQGDQMISSLAPSTGAGTGERESSPHTSLPDLSDSQTILSRILHRWFSESR